MKKFKDMKVKITFAESQEYDSVKEILIGKTADTRVAAGDKPGARLSSKRKKMQMREDRAPSEKKADQHLKKRHVTAKIKKNRTSAGKIKQ